MSGNRALTTDEADDICRDVLALVRLVVNENGGPLMPSAEIFMPEYDRVMAEARRA